MPVIIVSPTGHVGCRCQGGTGAVCVKGSGAVEPNGDVASAVYIRIYQQGQSPDPPGVPPSDAVKITPDANGDWCGDYVGGADCGTMTYITNTVWVWAEYPGPTYDDTSQVFQGRCGNNLPECCPSSSSSSSTAP